MLSSLLDQYLYARVGLIEQSQTFYQLGQISYDGPQASVRRHCIWTMTHILLTRNGRFQCDSHDRRGLHSHSSQIDDRFV